MAVPEGATLLVASKFIAIVATVVFAASFATAQGTAAAPAPSRDIRAYIADTWKTLTRDPLSCEALVDPKVPPGRSILYIPQSLSNDSRIRTAARSCETEVRPLPFAKPTPSTADLSRIPQHGLLYLPNRYVVPGGRFNEMYGWDSYFIVLGLIESGETALARGMVDNFTFEIENYGAILNANRSYYLTRSQPPFFSSMILAVYAAEQERGRADREWLARAYGAAVEDHRFWTTGQHLAGDTGLSRYYDFGSGPVPEMHDDPKYYQHAAFWFQKSRQTSHLVPASPNDLRVAESVPAGCNGEPCIRHLAFDAEFYKGDRALRESGFDVTFRFGAFGVDTHHYAPVCLNALLYKYEGDLAAIATMLGKPGEARRWRAAQQQRAARIHRYLWNSQTGQFVDYNFMAKTQSSYTYATMFYPLWTGLATRTQAAAVAANLKLLERPGGIALSTRQTGVQWDEPFGWAPVEMIAVEGLRRYGFKDDADRLSVKWLSMIVENFRREGTIREKYDVVKRSSDVDIAVGYQSNVAGFGWTNASFLRMFRALPAEKRAAVLGSR